MLIEYCLLGGKAVAGNNKNFSVSAFPLGKCSTAWRQWGIRFVKMTKQKSENEFSMSDLQVISCGSYMTGEQRHDCREFVWTLFKTKDEWDGSSK